MTLRASVAPGFLSSVITMVSFSAYAKIKDTTEKVQDGLLKSFDLLYAVVIPVVFLVMAAGGKLILIFLGEAWLPMTNAFRVLLIFFVVHTIIDMAYALFNGIGHPDKKVKYETVKIPLTIILIYLLTARYGIDGAALAMLLGAVPILLISLRDLKRLTRTDYATMLAPIGIPLLLSALLFAPVVVFKDAILARGTVLVIFLSLALGLAYVVLIYLIGRRWNMGPYKTLALIWQHIR